MKPRLAAVLIPMLLSAFAALVSAQQAPVSVMVSNGFKAVIEDLRPQAERSIGRKLSIEYNSSTGLKQKMDAGQTFDVAIVTRELMDTLLKERKVAAGTSAALAKSGVGVGVRKGALKPGIRTGDAMKKTLQSAKSITYAEDGASRVYVEQMFQRMGIAEAMKAKTVLEQGSVRATARVADGKTELVLTLASEILPVQGIELVGPLPAEYQQYVSFSVGVGASAANKDAAQALIKFLAAPTVTPVLKAKGMERP